MIRPRVGLELSNQTPKYVVVQLYRSKARGGKNLVRAAIYFLKAENQPAPGDQRALYGRIF